MRADITLTVRGLSLSVLAAWGELEVHLSGQTLHLGAINSGGVLLLSDTALSIPSLWLLRAGLLPPLYAGQPLQLSFSRDEQRSNALNVSFSSPARPSVLLLTLVGGAQARCATPIDTTHVDHCVPGVSGLVLVGSNFWPELRVRVQGQEATVLQHSDSRIDLQLPLVPGYQPGTGYDLTVIAAYGVWPGLNATLAAAVAFEVPPALLGAAACVDTGHNVDVRQAPQLKCGQGARVTFLGYRLPLNSSVAVPLTWQGNYSNNNYSCIDPVVVNSSALTCTLPPLPPDVLAAVAGQVVAATLDFGESRTNRFRSVLWDVLDAPFITAVSGCGVSDSAALTLPLCMPGESFTVHGGNFIGNSSGLYIVQDVHSRFISCATQPAGAQPSQLVLSVPPLGQFIRYNRSFTLSVQQSWRQSWSNTFTLHMAAHRPWGSSSSTGPGRDEDSAADAMLSQGVIAAVVVGSLLVIILSVAAVLRWRGVSCFKRRQQDEQEEQHDFDLHQPGHPDYDRNS